MLGKYDNTIILGVSNTPNFPPQQGISTLAVQNPKAKYDDICPVFSRTRTRVLDTSEAP
jgi:hypothetical protein